MTVGVVGSGPAVDALVAALGETSADVERVDAAGLEPGHRLVVVVAQASAGTFEQVTERARTLEFEWFAVELGGVGGYPVVDGAVSGFDPDGACYECLTTRVGANVDPETPPQAAPSDETARFLGAVAGRVVTRHLDPEAPDQTGTVVELPYTERELHPVPGCVCGGERDRVLDRGHLARPLSRALGRAERALDERVGLVTEVGEIESYPAPYYLAQGCDTSDFSDATAQRQAAGVAEDWDAAFMKALGECLERYCAGVYRTAEFTTSPAAEVSSPVRPEAFVTPEDWAGDPADASEGDEDERAWVRGEDLATGDRVHLPAELVHYPPPAETIRPAITTGLGLGNSSVEALLSGLYEVVERDASTIAWYSTYDPLELVVDDEAFEILAARAESEGLEVSPVLLTQDIDVPVVGVAVYRDEWPEFAMGTAADLDPTAAANKALSEAVQNWIELRNLGREGAADAAGEIGHYAGRPAEVRPILDPDRAVPADSVGPDPVPGGSEALSTVLDALADADLDAYAARTTTRDVQGLGFEAVRVLVPAAQPLFFGEAYFGDRAESVPESLGFEAALDRDHHPYP